jgi:hypothetical protein
LREISEFEFDMKTFIFLWLSKVVNKIFKALQYFRKTNSTPGMTVSSF